MLSSHHGTNNDNASIVSGGTPSVHKLKSNVKLQLSNQLSLANLNGIIPFNEASPLPLAEIIELGES